MEATKNGLPVNKRPRMAADLLWFASASLGAGLLAAIVAAALVMLLAQPAYASRPAPRLVVPAAESPIELQKLKVRVAEQNTRPQQMPRIKSAPNRAG